MGAAQNQHYVPKFVLRQFLSDVRKEQVSVFDKNTNKSFVTSIKNIMAERRFNKFKFQDCQFSFEGVACSLEDVVIPTYKRVVETQHLDLSSDEASRLSFLIALQFARTKNSRQLFADIEEGVRKRVESLGLSMADVKGWEPLTDDVLKRNTIYGLTESMPRYAAAIRNKTFFLMKPPPGRYFYLGDDPVVLHNEQDMAPWGNLGLAVRGIQIGLPLAADLLLSAWCPSVLEDIRNKWAEKLPSIRANLFAMTLSGSISTLAAAEQLEEMPASSLALQYAADSGTPLMLSADNVDWYNSLQMSTANRYIVCKNGDFDLAKRFNTTYPGRRRSFRLD